MTRFIEMKNQEGKAVLVNIDKITMATPIEGDTPGVCMRIGGEDIEFHGTSLSEVKSTLENDTPERISSNLFHIWEILRARLH